jgi:hypothetical protein
VQPVVPGQPWFAPPNPDEELGRNLDRLDRVLKDLKEKAISAALDLFTRLSARNDENQHALAVFRAREYPFTEKGILDLESVENLTSEEVKAACKKFEDVQNETDAAATKVNNESILLRDSVYGTKVHLALSEAIRKWADPNVETEYSALKTEAETGVKASDQVRQAEELRAGKAPHYGQKGTFRVDVYDRDPKTNTICVYDVKTGPSRLTWARMLEIARGIRKAFPKTPPSRVIIAEMRSNVPRRSRGRW